MKLNTRFLAAAFLSILCFSSPFEAQAGWLQKCMGRMSLLKAEENKATLNWIDHGPEIDLVELKELYKKSRSGQIAYFKKKHGITVIFKNGITTLGQFWNAPLLTQWTNVSNFLGTPFNQLEKMSAAVKFYRNGLKVENAVGIYVAPFSPFPLADGSLKSYKERPFGTTPLIILEQDYFKAAALHEFIHYLISRDYFPTGSKSDRLEPRFELFVKILEGLEKNETPAHLNVYDVEMSLAYLDEELAINELLLQYRKYLELSNSDIDVLLTRYCLDVGLASNLDTYGGLKSLSAQNRSIFLGLIARYKAEYQLFLQDQPGLKRRAKRLGLKLS